MIMITIVICVALELFTHNLPRYRSYHWFATYAARVRQLFGESDLWKGPWGVLAILVGPLFLVGILHRVLEDVWLGLFELLLGVAVLLYCLRYQPMDQSIDEFTEAMEANETERAVHLCDDLLSPQQDVDEKIIETCAEGVLVQSNERLFSVLFWFVMLGPLGALLYRLSWWLSERQDQESLQDGQFRFFCRRLYGILSWLPARLLVIGFAIVGSFEEAIHSWRHVQVNDEDDWQLYSEKVIFQSGAAAMHMDRYQVQAEDEETRGLDIEAVKAARGLVLRTLLAWGIVIAVVTLTGWLS